MNKIFDITFGLNILILLICNTFAFPPDVPLGNESHINNDEKVEHRLQNISSEFSSESIKQCLKKNNIQQLSYDDKLILFRELITSLLKNMTTLYNKTSDSLNSTLGSNVNSNRPFVKNNFLQLYRLMHFPPPPMDMYESNQTITK